MYENPITMVQRTISEQMRKQEDKYICEIEQEVGFHIDKQELIRALNYDRKQYEKGFADGRFFGIREVKSKLVHLKQCQAIPKEQFEYYKKKTADENTADYEEFIKRQICDELGKYLYENNLVTFTESDGFDNTLIIRGDVEIYNEREGDENDGTIFRS